MKYTVKSFDKHQNHHVCIDEYGGKHNIDVLVDGSLLGDRDITNVDEYYDYCNYLVGKELEIEYLIPNVELGMNVKQVTP